MIELRALSVGYGRPLLRDLNARFPSGAITALIGPNGCGKTTLLRTLGGLLPPLAGSVTAEGRALETLRGTDLARRVAYLPQSRSVPELTARGMVLHGRFPWLSRPRRYTDADHAITQQALERVGAADYGDTPLSRLSGGQRQRVYLAMTLAQQTPVLLLDEPTTYLDADCRLELMTLLGQLAAEGKTIVAVLHDLELAFRFAHRVAVLGGGQLCALGTPEETAEAVSQVFRVTPVRFIDGRGIRRILFESREPDRPCPGE